MYGYGTTYGAGVPSYQYPQSRVQTEQYAPMYQQQIASGMIQPQQAQQIQTIKGRPVSSYDEAKASMIDLDGSLFVFPDIANKRIYTKQIMLDGSAELKTYELKEVVPREQQQHDANSYVLKKDFETIMEEIDKQLSSLRKAVSYEYENDNADGREQSNVSASTTDGARKK